MGSELVVHLKVPVEVNRIVATAALIFSRWLPLEPQQSLHRSEDGLNAYLWFDITTTWWASRDKVEDLSRTRNVLAHFVNIDVVIKDVSDELSAYIHNRDYAKLPSDEDKSLQGQFDSLGRCVLRIALETYNRLVGFARSHKGQYWLNEYAIDLDRTHSYLSRFEAKVRFPNGDQRRFTPCYDRITVTMISEERFITREDWTETQDFVRGNSKTPLVGTLLAGSEELAGLAQYRVAITEAVTALEVALSRFARNPLIDNLQEAATVKRIGVDNIERQVDHMGLTGSVGYLLPLLFPSEILSDDVLAAVRDTIQIRQNIVHSGTREVAPDKVRVMLRSVRELCLILERYTKHDRAGFTPPT
jgi:hypothetical protein